MGRRRRPEFAAEFRAASLTASGAFDIVAVRYNVTDEYGTRFAPGCFTAGLQQRLPRVCLDHEWSEMLGRAVSFEDTPTELVLHCQLSDIDQIDRCREAYVQMADGTIDQFSVGFRRSKQVDDGGVETITEAYIYEVSLVLQGAVPGTRLLSLRSAQRRSEKRTADLLVPFDVAKQALLDRDGGATLAEALAVVEAAAVPADSDVEPDGPEPVEDVPLEPADDEPVEEPAIEEPAPVPVPEVPPVVEPEGSSEADPEPGPPATPEPTPPTGPPLSAGSDGDPATPDGVDAVTAEDVVAALAAVARLEL